MDHRPPIREGIIDGDLVRAQSMFERIIFHPGKAERPRGVEAGGFEIARHDLHRGDPAPVHRRHESIAVGEACARPPQAKARGIAEVFRLGGTRRGHIGYPRAGQGILEANARQALL